MSLVAGIDCSTQATKVAVCDSTTGEVVREARAAHPDRTEVDPQIWWDAFKQASAGLLDGVEALAVGGQQHGMVLLDAEGVPVRDALLWNDNRSAGAAADLLTELGGAQAWAEAVGTVPVASFTVTKLRWTAEHDAEAADRANAVVLPHDYLTHRLRAGRGELTTDRGDASGTGYWAAASGYRTDLVRRAFGRDLELPRVADPAEPVGHTPDGVLLAPGTGDNMAAALGLGLEPGEIAVSLGTSGTVFAVADHRTDDPTGIVAGFADATGRFLPLVCTLNAARVLQAATTMAGATLADLDRLALSVSGTDGLVLLPFLDGERTPPLPDATGVLHGLTRHNATPAHLVRAAVEGLVCGLADAVDAVVAAGVRPHRIVLVGGAARSQAVQRIAAATFGLPVRVPDPQEYVARGAARQAAWTLAGGGPDVLPDWSTGGHAVEPAAAEVEASARAREAYREVLDRAHPLLAQPVRPDQSERIRD